MRWWRWIGVLCILVVLSGCGDSGTATYDVRGAWDYVFTTPDGNTWDAGVITFKGSPTKGTFEQVNIYDVVYEGDYTVQGEHITIGGPEDWEGAFLDADMLTGTWEAEDAGGTWSATRVSAVQ